MKTTGGIRQYCVTENVQLFEFLKQTLTEQSQASLKKYLKYGCIRVNECHGVTRYDYPLNSGDIVYIYSQKSVQFGLNHPKLKILYEDESLIVASKGSGLHSVDTTGGGVENAASILERYIQKKDPKKRIYIVHRLDRDTSGVMIFAKTRPAQDRLVKHWRERILSRRYVALAEGEIYPREGRIASYLYEDEKKIVHSCEDSRRGVYAATHYRVLSGNARYSLVMLELETGRTNQIRVHLQSLGHPVAGDMKYHAKTDPADRLALHARSIKFVHPLTGRILSFEEPEPDSWRGFAQPDS